MGTLVAGIIAGLVILIVGAAYAGRVAGAIYAVAALGFAALGLILLGDLLFGVGMTRQIGGGYTSAGLAVGGGTLALLALVLMLMGSLTGIAWAGRHNRPRDVAVPAVALVAQLSAMALTLVSVGGWRPIATDVTVVLIAIFGLGTLAAALIAFWAAAIVRGRSRAARGTRSREAA